MHNHDTLHALLIRAFEKQDALNKSVNPEWISAGYPYYRALWTEAAEATQHLNWLWWRASEYGKPESAQQMSDLHIELCDIFHFGLSMELIEAHRNPRSGTQDRIDYFARQHVQWYMLAKENSRHTGMDGFHYCIEQLVDNAISARAFNSEWFAFACNAAGLSLYKLLMLYFGKSTLNRFRYENGYKLPAGHPDKYVKMWKGITSDKPVEDNAHLAQIVNKLAEKNPEDEICKSLHSGEFEALVFDVLSSRYRETRKLTGV